MLMLMLVLVWKGQALQGMAFMQEIVRIDDGKVIGARYIGTASGERIEA